MEAQEEIDYPAGWATGAKPLETPASIRRLSKILKAHPYNISRHQSNSCIVKFTTVTNVSSNNKIIKL